MTQRHEAIVIGSGIIGCSIAYELSKKGWKTLNIDKLEASGFGSTANTCAVTRVHYSTIEGTALAYESYKYWEAWDEYIGVEDPSGLAKLNKRGVLVIKTTANDQLKKVRNMMDEIGIAYKDLTFDEVKERVKQRITTKGRQDRLQALVDSLRLESNIQVNKELLEAQTIDEK